MLVLVESYCTELTQGIQLAASQLLLLSQALLLPLLVLVQPLLIFCPWTPEERVAPSQMHVAWHVNDYWNYWKIEILPSSSTMTSQEQAMHQKQEQMKMLRGTNNMKM